MHEFFAQHFVFTLDDMLGLALLALIVGVFLLALFLLALEQIYLFFKRLVFGVDSTQRKEVGDKANG